MHMKNDIMNVDQMLSRDVLMLKNDVKTFILCKQLPINECSLNKTAKRLISTVSKDCKRNFGLASESGMITK